MAARHLGADQNGEQTDEEPNISVVPVPNPILSRFGHFLRDERIEEADGDDPEASMNAQDQVDALTNAPVFTTGAANHVSDALSLDPGSMSLLIPQFALIGNIQSMSGLPSTALENRLVMTNLNIPWSAFICGSQGAGKSHTLSCLLENAVMTNNDAGQLPYPMSALVMHYDNNSGYNNTQLCEAAYLCSRNVPVNVLVSPSHIWAMKKMYTELPGLPPGHPRPKVLPLYLIEDHLDVSNMMKFMAVDPKASSTPLYVDVVRNLIREIAMEGPRVFTYTEFCHRVKQFPWLRGQETPLKMRLQLIDSFVAPGQHTTSTRPAPAAEDIWAFKPGTITIIDLGDPQISSDDACVLFAICLSIFLKSPSKCGRVVAMDEAHKFLVQTGEARVLTSDLTSIIRQQRHTGTRVFIATQEPTLSPELIDLANVTFVHRFLSPAWYDTLKKHLAGANKHDAGDSNELFSTIVKLRTGQALMFSPTALTELPHSHDQSVQPLGNGYLKINIRKRLTVDGGRSMASSETATLSSGQTLDVQVPMHVVLRPPQPLNPKRHRNGNGRDHPYRKRTRASGQP
ncbi:hypothetical protein PG994_013794 [Apiospora phragmitis]|uniref:P-loop containing nucleoside triphosphate hydrolase protein n=1 Tax=Apiospora phragmitis TaxID=2905665 RepID=A0ABR1T2H4_9PEZI